VVKSYSNDKTPPQVTSNIKSFMNICDPKPNPQISKIEYLALECTFRRYTASYFRRPIREIESQLPK
jgi:hypothetical protein